MPKYEIEVERTAYITYTVEAENEDEAEEQVLELAKQDYGKDANYLVITTEEIV